MTIAERLSFALAAAARQDDLLQSHRRSALLSQIALLPGGVLLLLAGLLTDSGSTAIIAASGSLLWLAAASVVGVRLARVAAACARDVAHWQRLIISLEQQLPSSERSFTNFKLWQRHGADRSISSDEMSEASLDALIDEAGQTHRSYHRVAMRAFAIALGATALIDLALISASLL